MVNPRNITGATTPLKVAVAQIVNRPGDIAANLAAHLRMIKAAKAAHVDVLLFPELSLTGYAATPDCAALARHAASSCEQLRHASGTMAVSVGLIEQGEGGRCYNAQALLIRNHPPVIHRKLNLPGYGTLREDRVYAKGDALKQHALDPHWRVSTLICADHWNPALPWLAALAGTNLLLVPAASARHAVGAGFDNPQGWEIHLTHTALTYGVPTVFANYCGQCDAADFWGGSRILDASGQVLARAVDQVELITATVFAEHGSAAQARLPTVRDSDPALVQRLLQKHLSNTGHQKKI